MGSQTCHPKCTPPPHQAGGAGGAGWVPTSRGGVPWGWGGADGEQGRPFQRGRAALAIKSLRTVSKGEAPVSPHTMSLRSQPECA